MAGSIKYGKRYGVNRMGEQVIQGAVHRGLAKMLPGKYVEKETVKSEKREGKLHEKLEGKEYEQKEHKIIKK